MMIRYISSIWTYRGILVGISSGAALWAAQEWLNALKIKAKHRSNSS